MRSYLVVLRDPRHFQRVVKVLARHGVRVSVVLLQVELPEEKLHVLGGVAQLFGVEVVLRGSVVVPR